MTKVDIPLENEADLEFKNDYSYDKWRKNGPEIQSNYRGKIKNNLNAIKTFSNLSYEYDVQMQIIYLKKTIFIRFLKKKKKIMLKNFFIARSFIMIQSI